MIEKTFRFSGEEGFHARPVSEFVSVAKLYTSNVELEFEDEIYEGKSPLSIMCGCIEDGCIFTMRIDGEDEAEAYEAILKKMTEPPEPYFIEVPEETSQEPTETLSESVAGSSETASSSLVSPASDNLPGAISLSGGIAIGKTLVYRRNARSDYPQQAEDIDAETGKLFSAIQLVLDNLYHMEQEVTNQDAADILKAHREIISDQSFIESIREKIVTKGFSSIYSIYLVVEEVKDRFEALKSERMRERAADVKDVSNQLIDAIMGTTQTLQVEEAGTILVAEELLPSDTIHLDTTKVAGFITEKGGKNCHSAIVARSLGIPAISNVVGAEASIPSGVPVILDGDAACYYLNPDAACLQEYEEKINALRKAKEENNAYLFRPSLTLDKRELELAANIFSENEMNHAAQLGAEGVGLFRTEFLYMNRETPPSLEEQFSCYKSLLQQAGALPVTIRTLDAGGDKPTPCLNMPKEDNPFLGVRAIRFCLRNEDIFRTQLKALLMASAYGNLRIMFPMISMVEELKRALEILNEEKDALAQRGVPVGSYLVGAMIETPSAAIMSNELAQLVDFFSIGSNDLNQYVMAADRSSGELSELHSPYHPAVLRLIHMTAQSAEHNHIWVGVCGESGGDPLLIPLYVGMGIKELSMSAAQIAASRRIVNNLSYEKMKAQADHILSAPTEEEVRLRLQNLKLT